MIANLPQSGRAFIEAGVAPESKSNPKGGEHSEPVKVKEGGRHEALLQVSKQLRWMGFGSEAMTEALKAFGKHQMDPPYTAAIDVSDIESMVTTTGEKYAAGDPNALGFKASPLPTGATLKQLDVRMMLTTPPPPIEWVADGIAARGVVTMLHGKGGLGKSMLALALAVAVVQGGTFLGDKTTRGRVLYIDAENGEQEAHRRMHGLGLPADLAESLDYFLADQHDIRRDEAELLARAESGDYVLIIVDSLASLWTIDESKAEEATPALQVLQRIAQKTHAGVVALHHDKKDGSDYRGSSAMQAVAQIVLHMTKDPLRDPKARCLANSKCRLAPEKPERWLEIKAEQDGINVVATEKPPTKEQADLDGEIIALLRDGIPRTNREVGDGLGREGADGSINRAVKGLCDRGVLTRGNKGVTLTRRSNDPTRKGGSLDQRRAA
jgi:hypothetical protein